MNIMPWEYILNCLWRAAIFVFGMFVMWLFITGTSKASLKYSDLDQYYIDCLSWHRGTGYVIIDLEGKLKLTCADGHAPDDPRHTIKTSRLVRSDI